MKIKKKTAMLVSFAVGAMLLATTALADITSKSGYEQLKDALKVTAENATNKFDNFTLDISYVVKDNAKTFLSESEVRKYDRIKNARENVTERESVNGGENRYYWYSDKTTRISLNGQDDTYYLTEYTQDANLANLAVFTNPFKEKQAEDFERIADALVGSLKDYVVVTENPDGSKELSGSLSEVQIPPLVNAVSSFLLKQLKISQFGGNREQVPRLTRDIFVKTVKGKAVVNKDGAMESILGTAVLSGKDEQGEIHEVTLELLGKLRDINATTVTKPDLTGKKVIKQVAEKGPDSQIANPQKFVGKFKNDILTEKDGKYVKIGERVIDIAQMDNKTVAGRYREEYKQGFEQNAAGALDFSFEAKFDQGHYNAMFEYTTTSGSKGRGNISFDERAGRVYLNLDAKNRGIPLEFDSAFSPALD